MDQHDLLNIMNDLDIGIMKTNPGRRNQIGPCRSIVWPDNQWRLSTIHQINDNLSSTTRAKWELTAEAFAKLLAGFDPNPERAGTKYESIRTALLKFFDWQGASYTEEWSFKIRQPIATASFVWCCWNRASAPKIVTLRMISLPSASAPAMLRRDNANRARASKPVAVLADPVFAATDPRVAVAAKGRALPPVQTENNARSNPARLKQP